jgi:peptidoglycan/xylan/chitin deacetylase (PgdA/CDA1 family)
VYHLVLALFLALNPPLPSPPPVPALPLPPFGVARVRTAKKVVALTFDACATTLQENGFDRATWEILKREAIPVTIYLSGRWVETHLTEAREMAAAPFVEFGNHSYAHPRLSQVTPQRLASEVELAQTLIEEPLRKPALTLRPPAGAWDANVVRAARRYRLPVVLWSVVSGDVGGHVPAARMVEDVLARTTPGSIVIFHINGRGIFTHAALPEIIAGLRERGYAFVTVSSLLTEHPHALVRARTSRFGGRRPKRGLSARGATHGHHAP